MQRRRGRGRRPGVAAAPVTTDAELAYEAGVEIKARSQWSYARIRFFRHKAAVVSLVILILFALVAIFAKQIAPYGFDEIDLEQHRSVTGLATRRRSSGRHIFGTDQLGRDYLSRIIYGIRTSLWVARLRRDPRDCHRDRRRRPRRVLRRPASTTC